MLSKFYLHLRAKIKQKILLLMERFITNSKSSYRLHHLRLNLRFFFRRINDIQLHAQVLNNEILAFALRTQRSTS